MFDIYARLMEKVWLFCVWLEKCFRFDVGFTIQFKKKKERPGFNFLSTWKNYNFFYRKIQSDQIGR